MNQERGNKFTNDFLDQLNLALEDEEELIGIILSSKNRQFSVGGDLDGMLVGIKDGNPSQYVDKIVPKVNKIISKIMRHRLPIIAAINGSAAGGGLSLALACDFRISLPNIKLSMAFGKLGLSPDSGSSFLFPVKFGIERALLGITQGQIFSSEEGLKYGAITKIVSTDELISSCEELITHISRSSLWSFSQTKRLFVEGTCPNLDDQLHREYLFIKKSSTRKEFKTKLIELVESMK